MSEEMKFPRLIQRVRYQAKPHKQDKGVDRFSRFEYMGAAEFEYGALPHALSVMKERKDNLILRQIQTNKYDAVFFGIEEDFELARQWFIANVSFDELNYTERRFRWKEDPCLKETYEGKRYGHDFEGFDAWWLIDHPVPFLIFRFRDFAEMWKNELTG